MNAEPKRRGRPVGSASFTTLTLAELNQRFKPEDSITVGRIFLEKGRLDPKLINAVYKKIEDAASTALQDSPKVEMTLQA